MIAGCVSSHSYTIGRALSIQHIRLSSGLQQQQALSLAELSEAESSSGQDEEELEAVVVGPSASFKPAAAAYTLGRETFRVYLLAESLNDGIPFSYKKAAK